MVDTETIFSGVEQKEVLTNFPIPIYSGEGCYIQWFPTEVSLGELKISEEKRVLLDNDIKELRERYYPGEFQEYSIWEEREDFCFLKQLSVQGAKDGKLKGTCGPCMRIKDSLSFYHTKRARDVLFFQECFAKYLELQGKVYPYIKSCVVEDHVFLAYGVDGEVVSEEVNFQKVFAGREFLLEFSDIARLVKDSAI